MKYIILTVITGLVAGCDLNEGPREESREAAQSIERGQSPDQVRDQLEDVNSRDKVDAANPATPVTVAPIGQNLEVEVKKLEDWVQKARRDADNSMDKVSDDHRKRLDKIETDVRDARDQLSKQADKTGDAAARMSDDIRAKLNQIAIEIDALDGEVNDKPGADPIGPG
ncbi:MAG: hypothetical protein ABMB14_06895 [Myxococcota bacterium]